MLPTRPRFNPASSLRCPTWPLVLLAFFLTSPSTAALADNAKASARDGTATATGSSTLSPSSTPVDGLSKASVVVASLNSVTASSIFIPGVLPSSTSTCPSRTVNYITHTLPQQCLKTNRVGAANHTISEAGNGTTERTGSEQKGGNVQDKANAVVEGTGLQIQQETDATATAQETGTSASPSVENAQAEETGSPLDNAHFLSFEEWKMQNLARLEQASEHAGRVRLEGRPMRPDIANALDSLGEDGEFDIGFGFGSAGSDDISTQARPRRGGQPAGSEEKAAPSGRPRKKDAGTTCKERFNYASFDCAATILKTNPKCKSASSILVENKDSYMLNECSSDNKFLIVELCDDILVDTVVLANFEFFSSMFRTFRISVADRYPVKMDRWKELGVFEARNAREIQAFAIENPLIWTRYLRIEFLSHFGAEFYCPVSLLRVHGTTMLEELRHGEASARGEDDTEDDVAVLPPVDSVPLPMANLVPEEKLEIKVSEIVQDSQPAATPTETSSSSAETTPPQVSQQSAASEEFLSTSIRSSETNSSPFIGPGLPPPAVEKASKAESPVVGPSLKPVSTPSSGASQHNTTSESIPATAIIQSPHSASPAASQSSISTSSKIATPVPDSKASSSVQSGSASSSVPAPKIQSQSHEPSKPLPVVVQPPSPSPTTQESFFKSFHKRLQVLEANATLSLQYIEEQSKILRDAFTKVEKRQMRKLDDFVHNLNNTVMSELKGFRQQYDQVWQSTVIELDTHRDQYQREILAVSTRLSLLAEELVWQKRMAVVQSTLLVLCLGLIIFVRAGGGHLELPIMQHVLNKSHTVLGLPFDSPRDIPSSKESSPRHQNRRLIRVRSVDDLEESEDEAGIMGPPSPSPSMMKQLVTEELEYNSTPSKGMENDDTSHQTPLDTPVNTTPSVTPHLNRLLRPSRSGPATPRGTRDMHDPSRWLDETLESSPSSRNSYATPESPTALTKDTEESSEYEQVNGHTDSATESRHAASEHLT